MKGIVKIGLMLAGIAGAAYAAERLLIKQLAGNPDREPGWRPRTPGGETRTVKTADGTRLRVMSEGDGRPILLVHGLLVSLEAWDPVWDDLVAAGHRVVGVDLRGHGGSNVGEGGHALEHAGDDVAEVLTQLDLRDTVVVGHSMGGMAALNFAIRHPDVVAERVAGLMISNSAGGGLFDMLQNKAQLAAVKAGVGSYLIDHDVHGKVLSRLYFGPRPSLTQVSALNEMHSAQAPETLVEASQALEDYEVHHRLEEIAVPTLVVASDKDGILPPSFSRRIADGMPGSRLEIVEGVGHMTHWEAPETFVELVLSFAAEVAAA